MDIRLYNARLVSFGGEVQVTPGEVWVAGERICYAGPAKPPSRPFARQVDLGGDLILPGFKNAHTHSPMTFLRSYADDLPLMEWLHKRMLPMEARIGADDVYWLSRLAILEYLAGGITANFDMYKFSEANARASADSGFRTVLCGVLSNYHYDDMAELERFYDEFNGFHPLVTAKLGIHAEYSNMPQNLAAAARLAARRAAPVYTHSSESRREVEECIARTGKTPTAVLDGYGMFNQGGGCFHCVHMTEEDLAIMAARGVAVVHCPASNAKLASGIAPVTEMLAAGIPVALGTDGAASNNALDMFREMYLCAVLQKLRRDDAAALPAGEALRAACVTGARVMGLDDCDALAEGKLADLTVISQNAPNMQPENDVAANVVYSAGRQNVRLTMVNGRVLYEDGRWDVGEDAAEIYRRANAVVERLRA